jgi:hypothetical protein
MADAGLPGVDCQEQQQKRVAFFITVKYSKLDNAAGHKDRQFRTIKPRRKPLHFAPRS